MFENTDNSAIDYIMTFSHSGKAISDLSRIKRLLELAGNPQDKLKFVHIAGTNGKGSMAQMFNCIFTAAGFKTGLFTSPYMLEYSDRIQVDSENISPDSLSEIAGYVKKKLEDIPDSEDFSQFEITQTIAFLYFVKCGCDIVVLETGLGGLLDCTNVVTTSVLTVIGSVDYDHTAILGDTLEKIAFQKAGIIKQGVPCVLSAGNDIAVIRTVREYAVEKCAQLVIPNITLMGLNSCDCFGAEFSYKGKMYRTSMGGAHQVINAMSVIEGINLINDRMKIPYEKVAEGIKAARLVGRVEVICEYPLTILDGAHNPDGLSALAGIISHSGKSPCHAVIGMCRDKNITDAVSKLIPLVDSFVTVDGFSERAENREKLAEIINELGGKAVSAHDDILTEIENMKKSNPDGLNLICGSLFLVSDVKQKMSES